MFKFLRPLLRPGASRTLHPAVQQDDDQTFRVRVRTARHGEVVEFRFTKSAHIAVGDDGNLFFRKPVVSPQHLDRGELLVQFDRAYRVTAVSGEGVEFVPVAEWTGPQAP